MDLTEEKRFEVAEWKTAGKGNGVSGQRQGKLHMRLMIQPSAFELTPPLRRPPLQLTSFSFSNLLPIFFWLLGIDDVFIPFSRYLQQPSPDHIVRLSHFQEHNATSLSNSNVMNAFYRLALCLVS